MPITAVTFDLWQTLLLDNREIGLARMEIRLEGALEALREAGEEFSEDQVREAYRQCYRTCHEIRAQERDVTFLEQIEFFIRHIDHGLMDRLHEDVVNQIATVYADSLFCHPPPPHPDAARVLSEAKDAGYRLGLISNTGMTPGSTFRVYMDQVGILDYFHVLTFSDEVRLAKPSRQIFLETAEALGTPKEHIIHVGDHLLNDVLGAKRAGMKTIWIEIHSGQQPKVDVQPDLTVSSLGQVSAGIKTLVASSF